MPLSTSPKFLLCHVMSTAVLIGWDPAHRRNKSKNKDTSTLRLLCATLFLVFLQGLYHGLQRDVACLWWLIAPFIQKVILAMKRTSAQPQVNTAQEAQHFLETWTTASTFLKLFSSIHLWVCTVSWVAYVHSVEECDVLKGDKLFSA